MARIVYGVAGEGSGHSSRAKEIISHIEKLGHTVKVVTYGRGYENLKDDFDVFKTEGLHLTSVDNKVSVVKTFMDNLQRLPQGQTKLQALRNEVFKAFQPDCVITDFEPMTAHLANHYDIPLVTVDNQHRIRYMEYPCPPRLRGDQLITENVIRAMVPRPDVSLVTTFYQGKPQNDRTFLFPAILRSEVISLQPSEGGHILVYLTRGFETLVEKVVSFNRESFLVYGYDRDEKDGHITYKPFSKDGFLRDLASSKAVMGTAGFTLITESIHLRKPYLAVPMRGQFEQELNAFLLATLGYGINLRRVSLEAIGNFLYRLPDFKERLGAYQANDNTAIKAKIEELLADRCALAYEFHRHRTN
jgi:uncharacterized protein (TIGR00661 family)